jgi:hypothetical protein
MNGWMDGGVSLCLGPWTVALFVYLFVLILVSRRSHSFFGLVRESARMDEWTKCQSNRAYLLFSS